ncbi:MAG: bifunctional riboflavin kinase/FAD synthetase [Pyrinomonadaceae bacterium]|nr:bifunctional riboflavin kinase/FAD synthetase [Pyrinomonadaceae bacterium]MCX7640323.1 bifunctional riboflavin kinase/FAD synthetase [Pyrinomonadaceae bacterium]MDW8304750.1 bifunctional riboflavin kinase/FAD synthetase [Acidobacteriota bacterium]
MRIFHGINNASIARGTVLTFGVFDGLHLGHQKIMQVVVERAREIKAIATVITFDPHPRAVLYPKSAPALLQTLDQRLAAFEVLGIQQAIVINFDKEFASMRAEEFIKNIIHGRLQAREVYLGKGFAFGKNREGNIELLKKMSQELGFFADEVPEVSLRGQRISSSKIRELLLLGKVNLARRMLGRPYGIEGQVIQGDGRGRMLGFPTANLLTKNRVIPKNGVYVTASLIEGKWLRSITNVGFRPTFHNSEDSPSIETHIFGFKDNLYGNVLRIRFLHRIRNEKKFSNIEELKSQIIKDINRAKKYFNRQGVKNSLKLVQNYD